MTAPPGPRGLLRDGALLSLPRTPETFVRISRAYGDLASFRVGTQQFFLINHPDLVREAFVAKQNAFIKGWGPAESTTPLGRGLLTAEGEHHLKERRMLLPAFHRQRIEGYANATLRHAMALRDRWPVDAEVDVLNELRALTLTIVGETLFGSDLSPHVARLTAAGDVLFRRFSGRLHAFARLLRKVRVRSARVGAQAGRDLRAYAAELIAERIAAPGEDAISMLLEQGLDEQQIRDEIVTFVMTGHETVALALTWAWRLLATHPEAQAKLHDELEMVLGDREPGFDDVRKLTYTQGIIAESLRLFPPQWAIGRRALEEVEVGGATVPRGAIVLLNLPSLQRDARWFDDPNAFRPERWASGVEKTPRPYTFLPFGVSIRRCIGEGFAWMEATLLLSLFAKRFRVQQVPRDAMRTEALLVLRPRRKSSLRFSRR